MARVCERGFHSRTMIGAISTFGWARVRLNIRQGIALQTYVLAGIIRDTGATVARL